MNALIVEIVGIADRIEAMSAPVVGGEVFVGRPHGSRDTEENGPGELFEGFSVRVGDKDDLRPRKRNAPGLAKPRENVIPFPLPIRRRSPMR
jgi:hypothetical protein